jgi:hypothetical protein
MKKIYEFVLPNTEEVEESVTEQKGGKEVTTTTKVEKQVDKRFFLKRPTRKLFDEAELFYGVKLSEGIKAGLLTRALLSKRFANDGGILSDTEKEEFGQLYSDLFDKQVELQTLNLKTTEERTAEETEQHAEVTAFLSNARKRIQEFEMNQSSLYDQTAENRARNKTILWWVLFLAYYVEAGTDKELPFFEEGDYTERLTKYDDIEENEEDFALETINKFFYYVSFWYVSKTSDPEQFRELIKFAEQADLGEDLSPPHVATDVEFENDKEDPEEEALEEEAPKEEVPKEEVPKEEAPEEAPAEEAPAEEAPAEEAQAEDKTSE